MTQTAPTPVTLHPGDPAPFVRQRTHSNPTFNLDSAAGRYLVLGLVGSAAAPGMADRIAAVRTIPDFDDQRAALFLVTADPSDESEARLADRIPGLRVFWDADRSVTTAYGGMLGDKVAPRWVIVDPDMRVRDVIGFDAAGRDIAALRDAMAALPPPDRFAGFPVQAPILILPRVFEPALCQRLIDLYDADGGQESGFMREIGGKTVPVNDASHKKRRDCTIEDPGLIGILQDRFLRRVIPAIEKAHMFKATRMERYIVGCYTAEDGGHFRAHRDNTTRGTAHRRFAVSVNLNDDFEGGEVSFPEYSPQGFKAPPGGAVVFSCALLHAVSRVTAGRRYAFLPFLYDDAAAKIREANLGFIATG